MSTPSEILKASKVMGALPPACMEELASKMKLMEVDGGHVFVKEGEEIKQILIVDSGTLVRTKIAADTSAEKKALSDSTREIVNENSIVVDEIVGSEGKVRTTGAFHSFGSGNLAYATITSKGPSKVWAIEGEDYRSIVAKPEYALEIMNMLAKEVRAGSKSIRGLLQNLRDGAHGEGIGEDDDHANTIKVQCYDSTEWVVDNFKPAVEAYNKEHAATDGFQILMDFTTERLSETSATFAAGYDAVCVFVNDSASEKTMQILSKLGVKMIASRCMGFDRIATKAALAYGITLARVPSYSPYAVAEHAMSLFCGINRKLHKASTRVKMGNFALDAGLVGMDIHGKTLGVMGTGQIGRLLCNIIMGFGAKLICYDVFENEDLKKAGGVYVTKEEMYKQADVIFLFMPLLPATKHTINMEVLPQLKKGVILVNSSRGGLVDTMAVLKGLKEDIIGGYAADVYENEGDYFFQDWSGKSIPDSALTELMGSNKVLLTAHQAFFTQEAINDIVRVTLENLNKFQNGITMYDHPNNYLPPKPK